MHRRVSTQARLLEQTKHTLAQQRGVSQSFHGDGPLADARKIEEVRLRAWRDEQLIELEVKREPGNPEEKGVRMRVCEPERAVGDKGPDDVLARPASVRAKAYWR